MEPNFERSVEFLKKFRPEGPWDVVAIRTDKKGIRGHGYGPSTEKDLRGFLNKYGTDGNWNIYFHINETMGQIERKADKTQIKKAEWLYVDLDPEEPPKNYSPEEMDQWNKEEMERILGLLTKNLPKGIPEPTMILYSGGGYWGLWKLDKPFIIDGTEDLWEEYESYNRRLEQVFGGDHCHNVERICRLPGTVNYPDAKKKAKGRKEALATVLQWNTNVHTLDGKFKKASSTQTGGNVMNDARTRNETELDMSQAERRIMDLDELDEWDVPVRVKLIIAQGRHPDPDQQKKGDNSRSAWVFDAVCNLVRKGVPDGIIYSLLTDKDWLISESVLEQKDPHRYAVKQILSAKEYAIDPALHELNQRHAVIGNIGGKCRIIEEVPDEVMGRTRITYSSFEDLKNRYNNRLIQVGVDKEGKPINAKLGNYWISHPNRAQYDFIKFMPLGAPRNIFNLWRGFAVNPQQGDCSLFLDHILNNICEGVQEYYDYILGWMARAVQQPASQGEVAIVLRGGKGTGKSLFAREFGKLFGRHFLHVANPGHLVGNFNAHLKDTIVLFADEAFFAGDRKHESVLKMLVTEDTIPIEQKHVDVEPYPNYIHLIMAANDPHVIRATGDERRYMVLNVSQRRQQDSEYFGELIRQMENGGREALLFMLQNYDLENFQVRNVPQTEALMEQKQLSMDTDEEWWFRKLRDGRLRDSDTKWLEVIPCDVLTRDYTEYTKQWNITRRGNETRLGRFLGRVAPHMERRQLSIKWDEPDPQGYMETKTGRRYCYLFGSIEQCRQSWNAIYGKTDWPEYEESPVETIDGF